MPAGGTNLQPASVIWEKSLAILKEEMSDASYRNFIQGLIPLGIDDGNVFMLSLPRGKNAYGYSNELQLTSLRHVYMETIARIVSNVAGAELTVRFNEPVTDEIEMPPMPDGYCECPSLIKRYTFDNFVMGESNRFAYAGAMAVAKAPAVAYNPLYIHGGVGLGKTHLIHAIGNYIHASNPCAKILYVPSETFITDVITSIGSNTREQLRDKYRTLDVLIIDDIQFIGGKQSTETEFFNVFNALHNANKQIIITSDTAPSAIPLLSERLKTRFGCGLVADIQEPDFETRVAILNSRIQQDSLDVDEEVIKLVAEHVTGNVRSLEGCLNSIVAYADFTNKPITTELARNVLKDFVGKDGSKRPVTLELIRQVICDYYDVTVEELESERRDQRIARPRQIAMYLSRSMLGLSNPAIGEFYGNRHYSTVMHACDQIEKKLKSDSALKSNIDDLIDTINNNKN